MTKTETPTESGRRAIYNFDAWTEAHYGQSFARNQAARTKYKEKTDRKVTDKNEFRTESLIFGLIACVMIIVIGIYENDKNKLDSPVDTNKKK